MFIEVVLESGNWNAVQSNVAMRFEFFLNSENQLAFRLSTIIVFFFFFFICRTRIRAKCLFLFLNFR